eukprot:gene885-1108_t
MDNSSQEDLSELAPEDITFDVNTFSLKFHPKEDLLVVSDAEGKVQLFKYSLDGNETKLSIRPHKKGCRQATFSSDGNYIFTGSSDCSLKVIDVNTGSILYTRENAHDDAINSLVSKDVMVYTGDDEGTIKVWDMRQQNIVCEFQEHADFISDMITIGEKHIVATSGDGGLSIYNYVRRSMDDISEKSDNELLSVVSMSNDQKLVCGSQDGTIFIYDRNNLEKPKRFVGHPQSVDTLVKVSNSTFLSGSSDGMIRYVGLQPRKLLGVIGEHSTFPIERMSIARDNRYIASISHDLSLKFWNVLHLFEDEDEDDENNNNNSQNIAGFHVDTPSRKHRLQISLFKLLTGTGYRNCQDSQEWCGDSRANGGRPYNWTEFQGMTAYLLDLYVSLQFDPECDGKIGELKKIVLAQPQPPKYNVDKTWWVKTFFPAVLEACTCGFNSSKIEDFDFVSSDLRQNFNNDPVKQKIWYLVGDYMLGIYKQRERDNRRMDFDAGLYTPFIDDISNRNYTASHQLRVGFPTWAGRSLWFMFHTFAQRIADSNCQDPGIYEDLIDRFKSFMGYFATNHPCPYCREHFISHVSVNDRYEKEMIHNEAIRFYPIEHLLMGGILGDFPTKLSAVKPEDKHSMALFFWKFHNAVTASTYMGCQCFSEEFADNDPFKCYFDGNLPLQKKYPRIGRIYPYSKRWEFVLTDNHNYTLFDETRSDPMLSTLREINALDTLPLRKELFAYWHSGTLVSNDTMLTVKKLDEAIEKLSQQFLATPVLANEYSFTESPLVCEKIAEHLDRLKTRSIIGKPNFVISPMPAVCNLVWEPSECVTQYTYNMKNPDNNNSTKNETKIVETSSNSAFSIYLNINNFYYLLFITLIFSIVF